MKSRRQVVLLLLWFLLAGAAPAYANNPPQPDGMLTLVLIFPAAIIGFRLAGAKPTDKERKWRILTGLALALCTLLTAAGTGLATIPLLIILVYGAARGIQAMARGQGIRRVIWGGLIILFTLFGVANFGASTNYVPQGIIYEHGAYATLREINDAELKFQSISSLDAKKNGMVAFASLEQLHQSGFLDDVTWDRMQKPIYRYVLVLSGDPAQDEKQYFVYATPVHYGRSHFSFSLLRALWPSVPSAQRTLAGDETGVIKAADLGGSRTVTRAETQSWPQF